MKRVATTVIVLAALVLGTAAVASVSRGSAPSTTAAQAAGAQTELTVWVGWSARELDEFKKVVAEYDRKNAEVEVKVVGSISDDKIIAAIKSGNAPDVVSSFDSSNVGIYCGTGAWVNLAPFLKQDKISMNIFPAATRYYTQYEGKRCALPLLADAYGFYYNKALFKKAGLTKPPTTFTQLTQYAKRLTVRNSDGSLKVVGFNPFWGWYQNTPGVYSSFWGVKWFDGKGRSVLRKDPAWSDMLRWQKNLVDYYGHNNLVKFNAGAGDEFSASNAFETGKVAMHIDGEWRTSFIAAETPKLNYATAPAPVNPKKKSLYGSGYINGTIIGIPKGGDNQDEAWALTKYLTTNTHALATFSNGIRNVPSTAASAKSKELKPDARFDTFLKVFNHPKSSTIPITPAGAAYLELISSFLTKYQAGKVQELRPGLQQVDKQIDAQIAQAKKGGGGRVP
jgi:multiple sugar transport system substrate-binding protein